MGILVGYVVTRHRASKRHALRASVTPQSENRVVILNYGAGLYSTVAALIVSCHGVEARAAMASRGIHNSGWPAVEHDIFRWDTSSQTICQMVEERSRPAFVFTLARVVTLASRPNLGKI